MKRKIEICETATRDIKFVKAFLVAIYNPTNSND